MAYWKRLENYVAKVIRGKRVSAPYRKAPDVTNEWLVVECKARQALPQWIVNAVNNARSFTDDKKLGIAWLHEKNRHHKHDLVVIMAEDFLEWFEDGQVSDSELSE